MSRIDIEPIITHLCMYRKLGLSIIHLRGKVANYHWKDYEYNVLDFIKPGVNIGLRTGLLPSGDYFFVVDLDSKDLLNTFYEIHPTLMCAPLVSTGRGWHIYLTWKSEVKTRHLGVADIIANGYVVAAPSTHPNGHVYRFIVPLKGVPPLYNPEWLSGESLGAVGVNKNSPSLIVSDPVKTTGRNTQEQTEEPYVCLRGVNKGLRHSTLLKYLGILHTSCFREEEALEKALLWSSRCTPPLTQQEVAHAVRTSWDKWDLFEK